MTDTSQHGCQTFDPSDTVTHGPVVDSKPSATRAGLIFLFAALLLAVAAAPAAGVQDDPTPANVTQLTDNDVADRPPTVAVGEDGPVAVWAGRDPGKSELAGFELYTASRTDGSWSEKRQLTDDQRLDIRPDLASTGDSQFLVWSRERASGGFGIRGARLTGDGLGERLQLTEDGEALHLNPTVVGSGDRWLVTWFVDQDGNLSTTNDHATRYALVDGLTLDVLDSGEFDDSSYIAPAVTGGGFEIAVARSVGGEGTVERLRLTDGGTETVETFSAPGLTALTASGDATAWASVGEMESITVADDGTTTVTTNATSIRDLSFVPGAPRPVLAYQARFPDSNGAVPAYHVRAGDGWTTPRLLSVPGTTTDLGTAATSDELVALASTPEDPAGTTDLLALSRRFQPDLTVDATARTDSAAVGTETTIEYTVTNRGDTAAPPTVVVLRGRTGGVDSATVPELGVGESTTATFSATVDRAGEFEIVVDPAGQVDDRNRTNNDAVVVLAQPDLGVTSVRERREEGQLQVEVGVENTGTVPAGPFEVRVEAGNETATGSLPGLGAGREIPVTVGLNASGLASSVSATVTVDPDGAVSEPDTTDNTRLVTLLQPDLAVAEPVTVEEAADGGTVRFGIRNGDTGAATATATLVTAEDVVSQTVEIPPARDENDTVVIRTALNVSTAPEEDAFGIQVEPETLDSNPTDNVFGNPPGGFPEPQPELSLSVESPENETTVAPGEAVPVRVAFENTGDGRARRTLTVEGSTTVEQRFEVPPGDVTAFTVEVAAPGQAGQFDLTLQAGDLSQTLSLEAASNGSTNSTASAPGSGPGGGGSLPIAILVVAVVAALGVLAYRRLD
ncbi:CARDB domain-containing protein [Halovenus halobia]|uniref:CARDB domain-containing protein n=1 Tax=Halovenus halobia TaxID=3396622 RepID=UPI003F5587A2